jgi:hypothetical protein
MADFGCRKYNAQRNAAADVDFMQPEDSQNLPFLKGILPDVKNCITAASRQQFGSLGVGEKSCLRRTRDYTHHPRRIFHRDRFMRG